MQNINLKGGVTLPAESGQEAVIKDLIKKWGCNALRDSDGTTLSDEILEMDTAIYSTICLVRAEQMWPRKHPSHLPQVFLLSKAQVALNQTLTFDLMQEWSKDKYRINDDENSFQWWEVIDRTTGEKLDCDRWVYSEGIVAVKNPILYHEYTVTFLVYQIWDSTAMYNAITNGWTGDKVMCVDPFVPEVYTHLMNYFDEWLDLHPHTDVVRLTTLAFGFMLIRNNKQECIIRDWVSYCEAVSTTALQLFEEANGYRLSAEVFVQGGQYADMNLPPTKEMLDWMSFIEDFSIKYGKDLVRKIHKAGKQAAMFWGDHWIGAEPFGERFNELGIDIIIGAAEDGNALRRVSDVPLKMVKELRFYPYFFPDVFKDDINPVKESMINWVKIRRAMMRQPVDRIGWGGYLSLANKFPDFIEHISVITEEFKSLYDKSNNEGSWSTGIRVGVLNCWGKLRSWMVQTSPTEKFYHGREDVMDFVGTNINEALAGLPVDVGFFSFDEILQNPDRLNDFDVIINDGVQGSAWSGGEYWVNPIIVTALRKWVYNGGGFIGVAQPSAYPVCDKIFQLSDILGVDVELGQTIQISPATHNVVDKHFITADIKDKFKVSNEQSFVFCKDSNADVLDVREEHIHLACNSVGNGRSVYLSSLPYNSENARLLYRSILWVSKKEAFINSWFSSNINIDCAAWLNAGYYLVANIDAQQQEAMIYKSANQTEMVSLNPYESKWFKI